MEEKIMVVDSGWFNTFFGENSKELLSIDEHQFIDAVERRYTFIDRSIAEKDSHYKQIVSYCIITCGEFVFLTQRSTKQTEKRLHNRLSFGVGGHVSLSDSKNANIVITGMERELLEEVCIHCPYSYSFLGVINDNSTEVNSVHAGVCYQVELEAQKCFVNEKDKMKGIWIHRTEIGKYWEGLEGWSKILISTLIGGNERIVVTGLNTKRYVGVVSDDFLCVPSALEMVLVSEGFGTLDRYSIANYFGITFPPGIINTKVKKIKYSGDPIEQGIVLRNETLNKFFNDFNLPMHERYVKINQIHKDFFADYIHSTLSSQKHIICGYDYHSLTGRGENYIGHVSIIINVDVDADTILLLDPGPRDSGIKRYSAIELYSAISKACGGLWIVSKDE